MDFKSIVRAISLLALTGCSVKVPKVTMDMCQDMCAEYGGLEEIVLEYPNESYYQCICKDGSVQ